MWTVLYYWLLLQCNSRLCPKFSIFPNNTRRFGKLLSFRPHVRETLHFSNSWESIKIV